MNSNPQPDWVYLDGQYVPKDQARISVLDRGFLYADGVYEVTRVFAGRPFLLGRHLARFRRSLREIQLPEPPAVAELGGISEELIRRNSLREATLYWQITRGAAPRHPSFPTPTSPTVLAMTVLQPPGELEQPMPSLSAVVVEDERWHRCDIKAIALLPNVLAHQSARDAQVDLAILRRQGRITEGSSTSIFVVLDGALWTHPADRWILAGVTRSLLLELARKQGIAVREEAVAAKDLSRAQEVLVCSTSMLVAAVTRVDGAVIGAGEPGPVGRRLRAALVQSIHAACST
jgi:D-alanine transaminase